MSAKACSRPTVARRTTDFDVFPEAFLLSSLLAIAEGHSPPSGRH
jgi:hypothetical protein